jgi:hypothetical protein
MGGLLRVFKALEDAERAREALVAEGFLREQIELTSRHDEAGPVEGNFLVGNTKRDTLEHTEFSQTLGGEGDNTYDHNFARTVGGGMYLLVVEAEDDARLRQAAEIIQQHGGTEVGA